MYKSITFFTVFKVCYPSMILIYCFSLTSD
nr:MAG TPA: hypothetical protein [Caudoviricetes sp.]